MANLVYLDGYKFERLKNGVVTYGYIAYDNYEYQVDDTVIEESLLNDDISLLLYFKTCLADGNQMFNEVRKFGIVINGTEYTSKQIENILKEKPYA